MSEPGTNQRPVYYYFVLRFTISILFGHALMSACLFFCVFVSLFYFSFLLFFCFLFLSVPFLFALLRASLNSFNLVQRALEWIEWNIVCQMSWY